MIEGNLYKNYSVSEMNLTNFISLILSFDKNINRTSVTVSLEAAGKVTGTISWMGTENTMFFVPSYELVSNTEYTVSINAKDTAGNPVSYLWKFRTG